MDMLSKILIFYLEQRKKKNFTGNMYMYFNYFLRLEMELRRSHSESLSLHDLEEIRGSTRRMSGSARSSFFRRRTKHKRNNSKDSREFNSFSETSLSSDSVPVLEGNTCIKLQ